MARPANRWGDDDREEPVYTGERRERRRVQGGGVSAISVLLVALSVVFVLGFVVCGGLAVVGFRKAEQAERAAEAELEQEKQVKQAKFQDQFAQRMRLAQQAAAPDVDQPEDADNLPPPKPGSLKAADPPPQPKPTRFDAADGRWFVLFRSKNPVLWNTSTQTETDFSLPLRNAPRGIEYLRLRRTDTGDAIIIPISRNRLAKADPVGPRVRWNGEGKNEHGGYHLGIAEGTPVKFLEGKGTIAIQMDSWTANPGSGFGHAHHVDDAGQRYSWLGKEIKATVFEVAVTAAELTDAEKKLVRE
jgi:hypothetical protein